MLKDFLSYGFLILCCFSHSFYSFFLLHHFYLCGDPLITSTSSNLHLTFFSSQLWVTKVRFSLSNAAISIHFLTLLLIFLILSGISYPICGFHQIFLFYVSARFFSLPLLLGQCQFFKILVTVFCKPFPSVTLYTMLLLFLGN